ncbi:MAG TPA: M48 family metalloprotease [Burkholderiales bacterium]|nr:M48 family metalloprotease [Burkholderiales bacterium]
MNGSRRRFGCALCGLAWLALARGAAAQSAGARFLAPHYQPPAGSDEQGLWQMMDRVEQELKTSPFVIRDAKLNARLRDIACRLARDHCADMRIYVVRTPHFNASMAPNGMMEVWTGLLLRCNDEAQLAAILGHEMGHYLRRHTLQGYRDAREKSSFGAFLGLGLAAAGVGYAGGLANLALLASMFAFTRDQEREADQIGLELMAKAGYAPLAAPEVWQQLLAEAKAGTADQSQNLMFATHPAPEERLATLRTRAEELGGTKGERDAARYRAMLAGVRAEIVGDELALRQYGRSEVVFDRLLAQSPDDGLLWYAKGEICRLRGESGDPARALEAYLKALAAQGAPPETYRSIVMVELKLGRRDRAQAAFETYLKLKPDAPDAAGLRMLLEQ